jgi:hypothetical protein
VLTSIFISFEEWSFQDGGQASLFKVGLVIWMKFCRLLCIIASIEYIWRQRNVRMDRKLMFYDAVLTSIFISFVYSTLNG